MEERTANNIHTAFIEEAKARQRLLMFAKKAEEVANKAVEETRKFIQENKNYLIALKEIGSIKGKLSGEEVKALCNLSKEKVIGVTEIIKTEGCEDEERYFNLINGRIQPE